MKGEELLKYPWGGNYPPQQVVENYADTTSAYITGRIVSNYTDGNAVAARTGSFKANHRGLYDMGGNIREFVLDWQKDYPSTAQVDPYVGPDEGAYPAERGGSWACRVPELRPNRRNLKWDYDRDMHSGFRLARTVSPDEIPGW